MIRIIVKKILLYLKGMKGNSTHLGFPWLTYLKCETYHNPLSSPSN